MTQTTDRRGEAEGALSPQKPTMRTEASILI